MNTDKKILILFHSGAGSTKTIAEIIKEQLRNYDSELKDITSSHYSELKNCDLLVFAFPTYHCSPSKTMMDFIRSIPYFDVPKKAFSISTYGLFSANTMREFAIECLKKNLLVCGNSGYRAPATDGVLLLPPLPFMFKYEKRLINKIKADVQLIKSILKNESPSAVIPRFKLYSVLNYPNKALGKLYKHKITLDRSKCIKCNKCIDNCNRKCWIQGEYPTFTTDNCEFCFKCIHHCPKNAILVSPNSKTKYRLDEKFYSRMKEDILSRLDC